MKTYKFSKAVQASIDATKAAEATESEVKFVIEYTAKFKGSMTLVTDNIFAKAVAVLKAGKATIEVAKFIADAVATEIYDESREAREVKKAAKAENEIVTIATATTEEGKKAVMTHAKKESDLVTMGLTKIPASVNYVGDDSEKDYWTPWHDENGDFLTEGGEVIYWNIRAF